MWRSEEGDRRAVFEALALPHMDSLYGVALRIVGDVDLAQDLVQETYLRAYRRFAQLGDPYRCRA